MLDELLKDPNKVGAVILLLLAVAAFVRGWIYPKYIYDAQQAQIVKLEKERDEFKQIAMRSLEITERTQKVTLVKL